ncbi:MAG: hypothetical protein WAM13_16465, partial [Candidatus Sulfotelmatobacter sp.]
RSTALGYGAANGRRRLFRSCLPQRDSITEYLDQHEDRSSCWRRIAPLGVSQSGISQLYKERGRMDASLNRSFIP